MRRAVRGREVDYALRGRRRESIDNGGGGRERLGPSEEHCADVAEYAVERLGRGQVARHHFDTGGKFRLVRSSRERAHRRAGAKQLADYVTSGPARGADHEYGKGT